MKKTDQHVADASFGRRDFLKWTVGTSVCLGSGSFLPIASSQAADVVKDRPKNILLVITDQQHFDTIAAGGCDHLRTPAMDRLYKQGTLFEASYSTNPVCSPARSSIFTSRTSSETTVYINGKRIPEHIPNMGQWFTQHTKYETVYAGKWHLPKTYTYSIPGFKVINTGLSGAGYICDPVVSRSCEAYIRNRPADQSFLMVASFMQPHDICEWLRLNTECPSEPRYPELEDQLPPLPKNFEYDKREPEHVSAGRLKRDPFVGKAAWDNQQWRYYQWSYYRHIEMVDAEIGRLLEALEETNRLEDTLIVFTSDHGEGLGHHQTVRKGTLYDESLRVPLIFSWPGHIKQRYTCSSVPVSGLDILPTLCDYAQIPTPGKVRGSSLKPVLEGKPLERAYVVSEVSSNTGRMVRTKRYKYIKYIDDPVEQLFDMEKDPDEMKNLAGNSEYAAVIKEHRQMLATWENQLEVEDDVPYAGQWRKIV